MAEVRKTFVIHVRGDDGPATVQEVRTGRQARLGSLRETVGQIERWLREGPARTVDGPENVQEPR
jgi:hypothetical protein